jgi:hypothetical protein
MTVEEAMVSNMWEIAAIVEVLERKGLCSKQDLHTIIDELRRKNSRATIPETAFPEPYLTTETGNTFSDEILNSFNTNGLLGSLIQAAQAAKFREGHLIRSVRRIP